jgi:ribosomal protein S18 acetylase RimI-like enzyme
MPTIRPYEERDLPALLELVRELQASEAAIYDRMKPAHQMDVWYVDLLKKQCVEEDGTMLVAEENGAVVGYATILTNVVEDGTGDEVRYCYAYVGDLVTARIARGRGIARLLLDECERRARAAGRDELRINVLAENDRAHHVYRSFGFADLHIDMRKKLT